MASTLESGERASDELFEPPPEPPRRILADGRVIERCVVIEHLGSGAFAQVYKTEHRVTRRLYADKILEPSRTTVKKTVDSFLQEATVLAHPGRRHRAHRHRARNTYFEARRCHREWDASRAPAARLRLRPHCRAGRCN